MREAPPELADLEPGQNRIFEGGVADIPPIGGIRVTKVEPDFADPLVLAEDGDPSGVSHVDYLSTGRTAVLAARRDDGRLFWASTTTRTDLRTGKKTTRARQFELPQPSYRDGNAEVKGIHLSRGGTGLYVVYRDGHVVWYDTSALSGSGRDGPPEARIVQEFDALQDGVEVTAAEMLIGDYTLIIADSEGGLAGYFPVAPQLQDEDWQVERIRELAQQTAPVTSISLSRRDRQFVTGDADGQVWLRHMTSGTTQAKLTPAEGAGESPVAVSATSPSMGAAAGIAQDGSLTIWKLDNPHPDGKLPQLFAPVHYEGRPLETFVWQSSGAGDDSEPKLSLIPLIWGTLKATFYAMLFATPIAILAAIYSSEFMQPSVRSVVKPGIEMMAGLPSVVLGYIAAQVLAPFAEDVLTGLLITFAAVPIGVMIFGFLWQLVPPSEVNRQGGFWAMGALGVVGVAGLLYFGGLPPTAVLVVWFVAAAILVGAVFLGGESAGVYMPFVVMAELVLAAILIGLAGENVFETVLFGGDLRGWLDGRHSGWVASMPDNLTALPGWVLLLTPIVTIAMVLAFNLYVRPRMAIFDGRDKTRGQLAVVDLIRFAVVGALGLAGAIVVGLVFSAVGFDLRTDPLTWLTGGVVDSSGVMDRFIQRNALNVGMIMGFAVIPIIYTVSEDALAAVPNTLRSASLGAGATPWQTAIRVVLPVAVSGIFSACMIGLGRAVGETMIVLMAAGNTPTMNLNIFDGMRTLSANIAVEMPEAPQNGTLYRVLFFSGLVLFAMTFLVNTAAEIVRIRFRRRAFQL
ncbi:MAG: ABC transporter permease subunit [Planctomycetota bacterium]